MRSGLMQRSALMISVILAVKFAQASGVLVPRVFTSTIAHGSKVSPARYKGQLSSNPTIRAFSVFPGSRVIASPSSFFTFSFCFLDIEMFVFVLINGTLFPPYVEKESHEDFPFSFYYTRRRTEVNGTFDRMWILFCRDTRICWLTDRKSQSSCFFKSSDRTPIRSGESVVWAAG